MLVNNGQTKSAYASCTGSDNYCYVINDLDTIMCKNKHYRKRPPQKKTLNQNEVLKMTCFFFRFADSHSTFI